MKRYERTWPVAALAIGAALTGCDLFTTVCLAEARPGIRLSAVAASTGGPVIADDLVAIAREGEYADTVSVDDGEPARTVSLVYERPGRYAVAVSVSGYELWLRDDVRVRGGECHVRTVDLEASLSPR